MLAATVQRAVWAFIALLSGVIACPDYDYMEQNIIKPTLDSNNSDSLGRRWYTVSTDEGTATFFATIWPSSTLPYCWENDATQTALQEILKDGWDVWQAAGVPYAIDMGEYKNCPPVDATTGNRPLSNTAEYLLIRTNNNGVIRTTVGFNLYNAGYGPFLMMDPSPTLATGSPAANMAHEIGHAWGFYHEQQRQSFWAASQYPDGVVDGTGTTNQINFICPNVRGYAALVVSQGVTRMNQACVSYTSAKAIGFNAMEYLPFHAQGGSDMGDGVFDWDSIMLYGSKIGGEVNGGAVQNVYTRASDGAVIPFNLVPSQRDVQRFKTMYPQKAPNPNPCLINQGCSPWEATFLRGKAICKNALP